MTGRALLGTSCTTFHGVDGGGDFPHYLSRDQELIFGFTYMISAVLLWLARRPELPVREEERDLAPVSASR